MVAQTSTLADLGRPADLLLRSLYFGALAVLGSGLVALAAQVQIPFYPVPQTLQTLAVLAVGAAYGMRLGAATLALYALEGALGLPVFAGAAAGPAVLVGPTGGYIVGFAIAAALVGWFAERGFDRQPVKLFGIMLAGAAILYIPGLLWLAIWLAQSQAMPLGEALSAAFASGLVPFIYGDILKAALAAAALPAAWAVLRRQ